MLAALGLGCALTAAVALGAPGGISPDAVGLVEQVNAYRAAQGRTVLAWDAGLARSAAWKAHDLESTSRFAHIDSQGRTVGELLTACGFRRARSGWGEALARGYDSPERVMDAFLRSEPHRHMLEGRDYAAVGAAREGWTWVLHQAGDLDVPLEGGP